MSAPTIQISHASDVSAETHGAPGHGHGKKGIMHYLWNTDHKVIAMQFLLSSIIYLVLGGSMAIAMGIPFRFSGICFHRP